MGNCYRGQSCSYFHAPQQECLHFFSTFLVCKNVLICKNDNNNQNAIEAHA
jgi:hypothetical protein